MYGLTRAETQLLRRLSTPDKVQRYLDGLVYNVEPHGDTVRSPRRVMRDRTAHCAEGAFLAAAAFRMNGRPPRRRSRRPEERCRGPRASAEC